MVRKKKKKGSATSLRNGRHEHVGAIYSQTKKLHTSDQTTSKSVRMLKGSYILRGSHQRDHSYPDEAVNATASRTGSSESLQSRRQLPPLLISRQPRSCLLHFYWLSLNYYEWTPTDHENPRDLLRTPGRDEVESLEPQLFDSLLRVPTSVFPCSA
ncbi:hypothetical protein BJX64DRAFT_27533 [Aspergillus heterothallicus]